MRRVIAALLALASPAAADVFMFQTPSGNIQCSGGVDFGDVSDVICEIIQRNGPPAAPRPAGCTGPWGHRFILNGRGPVTMECALYASGRSTSEVAQYGITGRWGEITCLSQPTGLQCTNADGHGFLLSRARQIVY